MFGHCYVCVCVSLCVSAYVGVRVMCVLVLCVDVLMCLWALDVCVCGCCARCARWCCVCGVVYVRAYVVHVCFRWCCFCACVCACVSVCVCVCACAYA